MEDVKLGGSELTATEGNENPPEVEPLAKLPVYAQGVELLKKMCLR